MLSGKNIAILVADGFDEHQMTEIQRALVKAKALIKTVAPEPGIVNGWQGEGWGHHFHVDAPIGSALGSDFDMLILPGGERSAEKLKQNLHARRILNHFLDANKPIAAIGAGVGLLLLGSSLSNRRIAAPENLHDDLKAAGAEPNQEALDTDDNIMSATGEDVGAWVQGAIDFFAEAPCVQRAA